MTRLSLRHVSHAFGATRVLSDVSIDVADGEMLVLLGPSGCGKSTLLRVVAGLDAQTAGEVWIDGVCADELEPKERGVALVFQGYALYPHRTVRGNLAFPLEMARMPRAEIDARVERTARALGLEGLLARKPEALSGGQMQRVALGRALVREPRIFLFDEPLSNLDARLRTEMRAEIARLVRALGTTAIYVTHDQAEAMTLATRMAVMNAGRIEQLGPPLEVWRRPATAFVAGFVGTPPMNLVRGRAASGRFERDGLVLTAPAGAEGELLLGVRPQDVVVREDAPGARLAIRHVERMGGETHVHLALGEASLIATVAGERDVTDDGALAVELPEPACHWFDAASGRRLG